MTWYGVAVDKRRACARQSDLRTSDSAPDGSSFTPFSILTLADAPTSEVSACTPACPRASPSVRPRVRSLACPSTGPAPLRARQPGRLGARACLCACASIHSSTLRLPVRATVHRCVHAYTHVTCAHVQMHRCSSSFASARDSSLSTSPAATASLSSAWPLSLITATPSHL